MNAQRKKSALKKVADFMAKPMSKGEAIELLKTDESNYTEDEITAISEAVVETDPAGTGNTPPVIEENAGGEAEANEKPKVTEKIDLSEFNYKNLTGESFEKYVDIVGDRSVTVIDKETGKESLGRSGKLQENENFTFELYKVESVMKVRFPGVKDSPSDFVGVKVKDDKPIQTTKIPIKVAHELNSQILNAHSRAGNGRYYLLKK